MFENFENREVPKPTCAKRKLGWLTWIGLICIGLAVLLLSLYFFAPTATLGPNISGKFEADTPSPIPSYPVEPSVTTNVTPPPELGQAATPTPTPSYEPEITFIPRPNSVIFG
ncbi:MAG: hypothetical protein U0586_17060, partial [Candidatus Brocadiaceae bacterium]